MQYISIAIEISALLFAIFLIKRKRLVVLYSPVYLFLAYYLFIFIIGWFLSPLELGPGGVSANIELNKNDSLLTLQYGLGICLSFSLGVLLNLYFMQSGFHKKLALFKRDSVSNQSLHISNTVVVFIFLLCLLTILMVLMGVGMSNIWYREHYLPIEFRELKIVGIAFTPIAIISAGYIFLRIRKPTKFLVIIFISGFFLIYFSLASRWFSLIPILFMLGILMSRPSSSTIGWLVVLSAVLSFILLPIPLYLRSLETQGILPYVLALQNIAEIINWSVIGRMTNNLFFSFSLTGYVAIYENIDLSYLFISLNPLPGSLISWYSAVEHLRINQYTPFNLPGELLNQGFLVAAIFYFFLGVYFSRVDNKVAYFLSKNKIILPALFVGVALFFTVSSLQYNLRSGVRLLYYMAFIQFIIFIINELKKGLTVKA